MTDLVRRGSVMALLAPALSACAGGAATPDPVAPRDRETLDPKQAFAMACAALEPNTSSHDPANWELVEARQVAGQDVAAEFDDDRPGYGCPGPTPQPDVPTLSPTAPPLVPEPPIYQAFFRVDAEGQIVARKLFCVIC